MKKRMLILGTMILLLFHLSIPTVGVLAAAKQKASSKDREIAHFVPQEGKDYVKSNYYSFLTGAWEEGIYPNLTKKDLKKVKIEKPYIIYNFNETQDPVYYFPLSCKKEVISILDLSWDGEQYSLGLENDEDMVAVLNSVKYAKKEAIFYEYRGKIVAENKDRKYDTDIPFPFGGNASEAEEDAFYEKHFKDKVQDICLRMQNFTPPSKIVWESEDELFHSLLGTEVKLYKPQGQYTYNMCWASAAATVINYWKHSTVTGFEVCNKMGIGYNNGGSIYDIDEAMRKYGVRYSHIKKERLTWKEVKKNINAGAPIILSAHATANGKIRGHAATINGYRTVNGKPRINIWNSSEREGKGNYIEVEYNSYFCLKVKGVSYAWDGTLYYC